MSEFHLVGADMAAAFTLPAEDWVLVDSRVAAALSLAPIADTVVHTLPNYRELLEVCQLWRSQTWPGMIEQAEAISDLSGLITSAYQLLDDIVKKLDASQPLTPEQKVKVHNIIDPLSASLSDHSTHLDEVDAALVKFTNVNAVTDARLKAIKGALGPDWTLIGTQTSAIDAAVGRMRGQWSAVVDDFRALTDGSLDLTSSFLLDLDLQSAILGWSALGAEALSFATTFSPQDLARMRAANARWRARAAHMEGAS